MAKEILVDGKSPSDIPSATSTNTKKVYNEDTLKALNIDINNKAFKDVSKTD